MAEDDEAVEAGIEQAGDIETLQQALAEDIEALQQALAEEKGKAERYLANWQRSQANFENYKKRSEQEIGEVIELAISALISNLLPIMDDLERALASVPAEFEESNWTEGVKLIYNKFKVTLEARGLTEIEARGEPFDPSLHEAVMQQEGEEGVVIEETQKGYSFRGKVIRPSLVIVGKGRRKKRRAQTTQKEE